MDAQSPPNTRLILYKATMLNFKSYAGLKELGPFHPRFTSIIGPNGSGKSNIVDAMLFILGGRAQQLRQPRLAALIHSQANNVCNQCRVDLEFRVISDIPGDPDAFETHSSFTVSRSVDRQSRTPSAYYIDGQPSTCEAVNAKLGSHGVDTGSGRHRLLILQGEVEKLSQMAPRASKPGETGLLEYLEEIIGSAALAPLIEAAQARQQEADAAWDAADRLLTAARVSLTDMAPARNTAVAWLAAEARAMRIEGAAAAAAATAARVAAAAATAASSGLEAEKVATTNELAELKRLSAAAEASLREHQRTRDQSRDRAAAAAAVAARCGQQARAAAAAATEAAGNVTTITNKMATLDNTISSDLARHEGAVSDVTTAEQELAAMQEKAELAAQALAQALAEIESALAAPRAALAAAEASHAPNAAAVDRAQENINALQRRLPMFDDADQLAERATAAANHVEQTRQLLAEAEHAAKTADEASKQADEALANAKRETAGAVAAARAAAAAVAEVQDELQSSQPVAAMAAGLVGKLLAAQRAGELRGIVGRLGDTGTADPALRYALAAIGGANLDAVVVETVADAQAVLEMLRRRNLGSAKLAVKEKLVHSYGRLLSDRTLWNHVVYTPDMRTFTPLISLIGGLENADPGLRAAWAWALGAARAAPAGASVEECTSQAERLHASVVTLEGTVASSNRVITGGGDKEQLLRWSSGVRAPGAATVVAGRGPSEEEKRRIAELEAKLSELKMVQAQAQGRAEEASSYERAAAAAAANADSAKRDAIRNINDARNAATSAHAAATAAAAAASAAAAAAVDDVITSRETLLALINDASAQLLSAERAAAGTGAALALAKAELAQASGGHVAELRQALDCANAGVGAAENALTSTRRALSRLETRIQRDRHTLESLGEELRRAQETVAAAQPAAERAEQAAEAAAAEAAAAATAAAAAEEAFNQINAENDERSAREYELSKILSNITVELEKHGRAINTAKQALKTANTRFDNAQNSFAQLAREFSNDLVDAAAASSPASSPETTNEGEDNQNEYDDESEGGVQDDESVQSLLAPSALVSALKVLRVGGVTILPPTVTSDDTKTTALLPQPNTNSEIPTDLELLQAELNRANQMTSTLDAEAQLARSAADAAAVPAAAHALLDWRKAVLEIQRQQTLTDAAAAARDSNRREYDRLRAERLRLFMRGFTEIRNELQVSYRALTLGGNAELELVDPRDPFIDGVAMSVVPPKKTWRAMTQLSGGERTLSSLALLLALHAYAPTPLYFFDEIDAALDYRNVAVVAHVLRERAYAAKGGCQLIVVSLRNNMFELADRLIGVYKPDGATRTITLDPGAVAMSAREQVIRKEEGDQVETPDLE